MSAAVSTHDGRWHTGQPFTGRQRGARGRYGFIARIFRWEAATGQFAEEACPHSHRTSLAARECGEAAARRRNAEAG